MILIVWIGIIVLILVIPWLILMRLIIILLVIIVSIESLKLLLQILHKAHSRILQTPEETLQPVSLTLLVLNILLLDVFVVDQICQSCPELLNLLLVVKVYFQKIQEPPVHQLQLFYFRYEVLPLFEIGVVALRGNYAPALLADHGNCLSEFLDVLFHLLNSTDNVLLQFFVSFRLVNVLQ